MNEPVIIPARPRGVHYHKPGCGNIDEERAAVLAREDAEELGYRAHSCVSREDNRPDPDGDGRRTVPA